MSYTKREWATGNVVGAVDLNRMEQGIEDASGGGVEPLIMTPTEVLRDEGVNLILTIFNKTGGEVMEAFASGRPVYINTAVEGEPPHFESVIACKTDGNGRTVAIAVNMESVIVGSPVYKELEEGEDSPGYMETMELIGGSGSVN